MRSRREEGFTILEMLISMTVLVVAMGMLASLLIQNARINKSQQMTAEVQANARNCLEIIAQRLRSAGWDPSVAGFQAVSLDPDTGDDVSEIEIRADIDADGLTTKTGEQVLIRHTSNQIIWRLSDSSAFEVLATNISNDADGDGTIEPMFTPLPSVAPSRIEIQITAQSPSPDPKTGDFIRHTVRGSVTLRKSL